MSVDRDHVLKEAAALLTRKATASMDEIARAAGIGRATLHRHFSGRDALVRALEDLGIRQLEQALDEARIEEGDAADAVRRLIASTEPVAGIMAFLFTENQLYEAGLNEGWNRLDARVNALFRRGQEEGAFRLDLTSAWLTEALYGLIGSGAWAVQDGRLAAKDRTRMVAELLLGGAERRMKQ
ncbi:TetR/AcrR family transcriptional regulator [Streptomyces albireticuli]|uniref:TetR family transcriptional regulator n=1 Tax=Streptomyces albireticuli TaxID=1940 RepID=A0A2A2D805_9ACTN|nr:TetR/AcrR family transcriptional regulator [Streptomyces albireticuli]MCD9143329.1 TetR/AcrR family transcriptional regulator [Streptomyces albireticuli]MCD9163771.1 TetR/AcrR family transcriptional regulator [Streptomyces albireticuli]MCD9191446.1 TetR/AcrR family transcriptional regulator [Streptomyces albireticuli]PAU47645.1 TetR family transcriptional regulator [Streptomyces albireticuli]